MFGWKYKAQTFEKEVYRTAVKLNLLILPMLMLFLFCFSNVSITGMVKAIAVLIGVSFVIIVLIIPVTNKLITHNISEKMEQSKTIVSDDDYSRSMMLRILYKMPFYIALEVFFADTLGLIGFSYLSHVFGFFSQANAIYSYFASLYVAIASFIMTWSIVQDICMHYAKDFVMQGIEVDENNFEKGFGFSLKQNFVLFIVIPASLCILSILFLVFGGFLSSENNSMHIHYESDFTKVFYNLYVLFTNFVLLFFSGYIFYSSIQKQIDSSEKGLKSIYNDQNESELIECGFSNELDYNVFLINQVILKYRDLIQRINYTKSEIAMSSHNLTDLWNNTKNTYEQCSTSIDFIKASLDEFSNLSNEIVEKVGNVTSMANMNFNSVAYGVDFITQNIQNMKDIENSNDETIFVIKKLNEKIDNIGSVVKMIDSVADQIKIIALNAELEAMNAGDAGKNFGIVATEVRRLANDTLNAVTEIKNSISEIQDYSDKLILSSEDGTKKIENGMTLSKSLEDKFQDIYKSSDNTAISSQAIQEIVFKENESFNYLKNSIKNIADTMEKLELQSTKLSESCDSLSRVSSQIGYV
ncbi:MAG: methyl-accepting chemotaxis protein [Treponemataceae bacterium]|nr:methyl-accepting chemotaxis protein [Spirochaetales bacterium]MDY6031739.1 methyl-accepting chemotaxis protein [Treponemataceae bacterium]